MSKPPALTSHPLRCHPSNQQWYRSLAIIFRDNRPLLVRSLLNSGKIVEGRFDNDLSEKDFSHFKTQSSTQSSCTQSSFQTQNSFNISGQGHHNPLSGRNSNVSQVSNQSNSLISNASSTDTNTGVSGNTHIHVNANTHINNSTNPGNSQIMSNDNTHYTEINYLDWTIFTSLDSIDIQLNQVDNETNPGGGQNRSGTGGTGKAPQNASPAHTVPNQPGQHKLASSSTNSNYIGVLQPSDTHKIHGYVTASRIKFILLLDSSKPMPRDVDIKHFFENLHQIWMKLTANPFYKPGKIIKNMPKFIKMIDGLILKL